MIINSNINIELLKFQIFKNPFINQYLYIQNNGSNDSKKTNNNKKIKIYDFFSSNEIKISIKIQSIPYFYNYYNTVINYDRINIYQVFNNSKIIEKININENIDQKYLLFQYRFDSCNYIEFNEFIFTLTTPKVFIFFILQSFSYLLDSLINLNTKNICFFDLCPENIFFKKMNQSFIIKPILQNFDCSLQMDILKSNNDYIGRILERINNFIHKPLEVHFLFYLFNNNNLYINISNDLIEEICTNFVNNMTILSFFTQKYRDNYKKSCIATLQAFLHMPKLTIINTILDYANTWDNYSLSIIYLYIIGNIIRVFSLKETFINDFLIILLKNIDPNPLKRENLMNCKERYNSLFYKYTNWSFINSLSLDKMDKLFDLISK
jgi:hypothetical protein